MMNRYTPEALWWPPQNRAWALHAEDRPTCPPSHIKDMNISSVSALPVWLHPVQFSPFFFIRAADDV